MKTYIRNAISACALSVSVIGLFTPVLADDSDSYSERLSIVDLCKKFQDKDPYKFEKVFGNLGQCVSFWHTLPVEFCKLVVDHDYDQYVYGKKFDNLGECISKFKRYN